MSVSDLLGIAGLLVGLLAIPISFYTAKRYAQRSILSYSYDRRPLLEPNDELSNTGLEVRFEGRRLRELTRTIVAVWNSGNTTIAASNFQVRDPLRIQFDQADILLESRITSASRTQIAPTLKLTSKSESDSDGSDSVSIEIDFLDPNDGFIVEILHEGAGEAQLLGTGRGIKLSTEGSASLHDEALDVVEIKSAYKRFKARATKRTVRVVAVMASVMLAYIAIGAAALVWAYIARGSVPPLVDLAGYDLSSAGGQRDFARSVDRAQPAPSPFIGWALIIGGMLTAAPFIYIAARGAIRKIPSSVVQEREYFSGGQS